MNKKGILYLILTATTYGFYQFIGKTVLNKGIEFLVFSGLTIGVAALVLTPFFWATKEKKKNWVAHLRELVFIGVVATSGVFFVIWGLSLTSAINTGFLSSLTPIPTAIISYFLLRERLPKKFFLSLGIAILGIFLLSTGGKLSLPKIGDLIVLIGVIFWGLTNSYAKRVMGYLSSFTISYWRSVFGAIFLLFLMSIFVRQEITLILSSLLPMVLAGLLWAGVVVWFYKGVDLVGASLSATFMLLTPIVTTILAWRFLGEGLNLIQGTGGVLILVSLIALTKLSKS